MFGPRRVCSLAFRVLMMPLTSGAASNTNTNCRPALAIRPVTGELQRAKARRGLQRCMPSRRECSRPEWLAFWWRSAAGDPSVVHRACSRTSARCHSRNGSLLENTGTHRRRLESHGAAGTTRRRSLAMLLGIQWRSEEHTSELQSHLNFVCRLLLEKKNLFNYCY